jgi:hypothetical protein
MENKHTSKVQITITSSNLVEVVITKIDGSVKKFIPYEKLMDYFKLGKELKQSKKESKIIQATFLPADTVYTKTYSDGGMTCYILKRACKLPMEYFGKGYKTVPIPNLIFKFHYAHEHMVDGGVVAIANEHVNNISLSTPLYQFPFTNASLGHLCWGANRTKINDIRQLSALPDYFLGLPNSMHSFSASSNSLNLEIGPLLEMLELQEHYDDILLSPLNQSFGKWLSKS